MPPAPRATNPWYLRPFFGATPVLPTDALRTLLLVSFGMFFETYDIGLLSSALPQIADDLGIATGDSGYLLGAIRAGGLATLPLVLLADRVGRRRIFLVAFVGMSVGTFGTALSQTPAQFAAMQFVTRSFLLTAASLALVILVEEMPAAQRGAAIGLFNVLGGIGFGLGAGLYAAVDRLPFGWRTLYGVGILALFVVPFFGRAVRETDRFARVATRGRAESSWLGPLRRLYTTHPTRVVALGLAGLLSAMGTIAFGQYASLHLQANHGWAPGGYSALVLVGGVIPLFGNVLGGRGSDRFGRRAVGGVSLCACPLFVALFYLGPGEAAFLVAGWTVATFFMVSGDLVIRALATELFPTDHRSTASGWLILVQTIGWTSGLLIVGLATARDADLAAAIAGVSIACALAGLCLAFVPETNRRELEVTSGERPG